VDIALVPDDPLFFYIAVQFAASKSYEIKREPRATKELKFIRPEIEDVHSVVVGGYSNAKFRQNH
jgi:hypothetical protein